MLKLKDMFLIIPALICLCSFTFAQDNALLEEHFSNPPKGYEPTPIWWWVGEPLDRERIAWQLDQLKSKGILNPCVIYSHTASGFAEGGIEGADPFPFTPEWWEIWNWTLQECQKRGMTLSFSEYTTFNIGQKRLLNARPDLHAAKLSFSRTDLAGPDVYELPITPDIIGVSAFPAQGISEMTEVTRIDREHKEGTLRWDVPSGDWTIVVTKSVPQTNALDGTNPEVGKYLADEFYGEFKRRNPEGFKQTFYAFFQDELSIGLDGAPFPMWSSRLKNEFQARKGYDISEFLAALNFDIGPITPKVRMDYYDVAIALVEESYFRPVYDFMEQNGILHAHDQVGRCSILSATSLYGDYYRTQRWYNAPGNDCSGNLWNFRDTKLASSIANLYQRPRVWLEAFNGGGWGMPLGTMLSLINAHYAMGSNLFNKHGFYYTTFGGWYEWAPPDAHFRQPYWIHMDQATDYITRMSFLLSRGVHVCDAAILYPVETIHAYGIGSLQARAANDAMWNVGLNIYRRGIDFDYVDHQSIERAEIKNRRLVTSEIPYKVIILPAESAIRFATLEKIRDFYRQGGVVIAFGCLPQASDRAGCNDPQLDEAVKEIFGLTADQAASEQRFRQQTNSNSGIGIFIPNNYDHVGRYIDRSISRDFKAVLLDGQALYPMVGSEDFYFFTRGGREASQSGFLVPDIEDIHILHRKTVDKDIYYIYNCRNSARTIEAIFGVKGYPEIWNAWDGRVEPLWRFHIEGESTRVRLDLGPNESQIIVFDRNSKSRPSVAQDNLDEILNVKYDGNSVKVTGTSSSAYAKEALVTWEGKTYSVSDKPRTSSKITYLDGYWQFELKPTMDNRWGDFRLPPTDELIGAQAHSFLYARDIGDSYEDIADVDETRWRTVRYSFGPEFWTLGPISPGEEAGTVLNRLLEMKSVGSRTEMDINGKKYSLSPYSISEKWGMENDPVLMTWRSGPHGLKQYVPDDFIDLGQSETGDVSFLWTTVSSDENKEVRLHLGATGSVEAWLNGRSVLSVGGNDTVASYVGMPEIHNRGDTLVQLNRGVNYLVVQFEQPASSRLRGFVVMARDYQAIESKDKEWPPPLNMSWYQKIMNFDAYPQQTNTIGWYRFPAPPAVEKMEFTAYGNPAIWFDGEKAEIKKTQTLSNGAARFMCSPKTAKRKTSTVTLRLELEPGYYAGAAIPEPVNFECGVGLAKLGDWSALGLSTYSGAAWYRYDVEIRQEKNYRVIVDLGRVEGTAELKINDHLVDIRLMPPWQFDISSFVRPGKNKIEVLVTNTLANYYSVHIPSVYVGPWHGGTAAGIYGPASLKSIPIVELEEKRQ